MPSNILNFHLPLSGLCSRALDSSQTDPIRISSPTSPSRPNMATPGCRKPSWWQPYSQNASIKMVPMATNHLDRTIGDVSLGLHLVVPNHRWYYSINVMNAGWSDKIWGWSFIRCQNTEQWNGWMVEKWCFKSVKLSGTSDTRSTRNVSWHIFLHESFISLLQKLSQHFLTFLQNYPQFCC